MTLVEIDNEPVRVSPMVHELDDYETKYYKTNTPIIIDHGITATVTVCT